MREGGSQDVRVWSQAPAEALRETRRAHPCQEGLSRGCLSSPVGALVSSLSSAAGAKPDQREAVTEEQIDGKAVISSSSGWRK